MEIERRKRLVISMFFLVMATSFGCHTGADDRVNTIDFGTDSDSGTETGETADSEADVGSDADTDADADTATDVEPDSHDGGDTARDTDSVLAFDCSSYRNAYPSGPYGTFLDDTMAEFSGMVDSFGKTRTLEAIFRNPDIWAIVILFAGDT